MWTELVHKISFRVTRELLTPEFNWLPVTTTISSICLWVYSCRYPTTRLCSPASLYFVCLCCVHIPIQAAILRCTATSTGELRFSSSRDVYSRFAIPFLFECIVSSLRKVSHVSSLTIYMSSDDDAVHDDCLQAYHTHYFHDRIWKVILARMA